MSTSTTPDPIPAFSGMLRTAFGHLLAPEAKGFTQMFAEDGVMEFPYAPPGGVERLDGREALAAYLPKVVAAIEFERLSEPTIHRSEVPGVFVLEFSAEGRSRQTGRPYRQRYISVVTLHDGYIVRYVDYWNPLVLLHATGGETAVAAAARQEKEDARGQR